MAWRASHYAAAGALALGALGWATREAWSGRRPVTAPPIRVERAYVDYADTLSRSETLSTLLARRGIVGRDYSAFLGAATGADVLGYAPVPEWLTGMGVVRFHVPAGQ